MRTLQLVLALVVAAKASLVFGADPVPAAAHRITLHGSVKEDGTGKPVFGATLHVDWLYVPNDPEKVGYMNDQSAPVQLAPPAVVQTDEEGQYNLDIDTAWAAKPRIAASVEVSHERYGKSFRALNGLSKLAAGEPQNTVTTGLDIKLSPCADLTGTLTDPDGKPLAGVRVKSRSVYGYPQDVSDETTTDAEGRFNVRTLAGRAGLTEVWAFPIDRGPVSENVSGRRAGKLVAGPGFPVNGSLLDANGKPIVGIDVAAYLQSTGKELHVLPARVARTDSTGRFAMQPLAPGDYLIGLLDTNSYTDHRDLIDQYLLLPVTVSKSGNALPVELRPAPQVKIKIKTVDTSGQSVDSIMWTHAVGSIESSASTRFASTRFARIDADGLVCLAVFKGQDDTRLEIAPMQSSKFVCCYHRADGIVHYGPAIALGKLDQDVTDITIIRQERASAIFHVHDGDGYPVKANVVMTYKPAADSAIQFDQKEERSSRQNDASMVRSILPDQPVEYSVKANGFKVFAGAATFKPGENRTIDVKLVAVD